MCDVTCVTGRKLLYYLTERQTQIIKFIYFYHRLLQMTDLTDSLCCVLGLDTRLTQYFSQLRNINDYTVSGARRNAGGGGGVDGDLPRGRLSSHRGMEMKHTLAEWATRLNCKHLEA